jgi:hypothetical protein
MTSTESWTALPVPINIATASPMTGLAIPFTPQLQLLFCLLLCYSVPLTPYPIEFVFYLTDFLLRHP